MAMAERILATLAAPSGIMTAITKALAAQGMTQAQLYAVTGLSSTDWNNLQTALNGANAAAFLKFSTAAGVIFAAEQSPAPSYNDPNGSIVGKSLGAYLNPLFGDLT
jgi:hypothetical protein